MAKHSDRPEEELKKEAFDEEYEDAGDHYDDDSYEDEEYEDDDEYEEEDEEEYEDRKPVKKSSEKSSKKKKKKHSWLFALIMIALCCVIAFSGYKVVKGLYNYRHNASVQNKVSEIFYGTTEANADEQVSAGVEVSGELNETENTKNEDEIKMVKNLAALKEENPDTFGWLTIPGTPVDYVVMHGETNDKYLHSDFYLNYNFAGELFLDANNVVGAPLQNYIIYGHRMGDKSMFGSFGQYKDQSFYDEHNTFTLTLEDGVYTGYIFAVVQTTTDYSWWQVSFASEEERQSYITSAKQASMVSSDVTVGEDEQLVTFSTCDYVLDDYKGRLVIMAKLVKNN